MLAFLRLHPRTAKACVLGLLLAALTLAAYLGLQLHLPAQTHGELFLEWAAFLLSLLAVLAVLLSGGRLLRKAGNPEDVHFPAPRPIEE